MGAVFVWRGHFDTLLRELWVTAAPTREIAEKLGTTRNAVIGRARRLGLGDKPALASVQRPDSRPALFADFPAAQAMEQLTLTRCRFPLGDAQETGFRFCCDPVEAVGKPYCREHAQRAYEVRARVLRPATRTGALHGRAA